MSRLGDNIKRRGWKKADAQAAGQEVRPGGERDTRCGSRNAHTVDVQARVIAKVLGLGDVNSASAFGMELDASARP